MPHIPLKNAPFFTKNCSTLKKGIFQSFIGFFADIYRFPVGNTENKLLFPFYSYQAFVDCREPWR